MDSLHDCACIVSGGALEIAPRVPRLDVFGSFYGAQHRIFMSATVTDDSFLVKGLRLSADTIKKSTRFQRMSGDGLGKRCCLIPSLINETLERSVIVPEFARPRSGRDFGVVALVPSFSRSKDWEAYGSTVATTKTIYTEIEKLKAENCDKALVIANRYDGIDLPDDACVAYSFLIPDQFPDNSLPRDMTGTLPAK